MKRFFKWVTIVVVSLFALIIGIKLFIFLRDKHEGAHNLEFLREELRAKGEKLTFSELVEAEPPPDAENFYADPIWQFAWDAITKNLPRDPKKKTMPWDAPLTPEEHNQLKALFHADSAVATERWLAIKQLQDSIIADPVGRTDKAAFILQLMAPANPGIEKLSELSVRPFAYLPIRYEDGFHTRLPQLSPILHFGQLAGGKALAEVVLGQSDEAAKVINAELRIAEKLNEPIALMFLVRLNFLRYGVLPPLDYGIEKHEWTSAQLLAFQSALEKENLIAVLERALCGERACFNQSSLLKFSEIYGVEQRQSLIVTLAEWIYQDYQKVFFIRWINQFIQICRHPSDEGINANQLPAPVVAEKNSDYLQREQRIRSVEKLPVLLNHDSIGSVPLEKGVVGQTQVNQTVIACALERYRISHGSYPVSLDALVPEYLTKIPHSLITGKSMNYSLNPGGTFQLWSPGWNLKSLGGKPGEYRGEGDIVWGQPVPMKSRETPKQ
jgi:hypothetical protein